MARTGQESDQEADQEAAESSRLRRIGVGVIGGLVLVAGVVMLALPGPGLVVVVAGLALLASEFDWAERWLDATRDKAQTSAQKSASSRRSVALTALGGLLLLAAGALCFTGEDFGIPLVSRVNSPLTGALLVLSGLIVIGLTLWQRRQLVAAGRRGEGPLAPG